VFTWPSGSDDVAKVISVRCADFGANAKLEHPCNNSTGINKNASDAKEQIGETSHFDWKVLPKNRNSPRVREQLEQVLQNMAGYCFLRIG
jgi:hypothetical protein